MMYQTFYGGVTRYVTQYNVVLCQGSLILGRSVTNMTGQEPLSKANAGFVFTSVDDLFNWNQ